MTTQYAYYLPNSTTGSNFVDMSANPPIFQPPSQPSSWNRIFGNQGYVTSFFSGMKNKFCSYLSTPVSSGVTWVNPELTQFPQQMFEEFAYPVQQNLSQPVEDTMWQTNPAEPEGHSLWYQRMEDYNDTSQQNTKSNYYPSSMLKKPSKPLNPNAKDFIPKKFSNYNSTNIVEQKNLINQTKEPTIPEKINISDEVTEERHLNQIPYQGFEENLQLATWEEFCPGDTSEEYLFVKMIEKNEADIPPSSEDSYYSITDYETATEGYSITDYDTAPEGSLESAYFGLYDNSGPNFDLVNALYSNGVAQNSSWSSSEENSRGNDTCISHENASDLINDLMDSALIEYTKKCSINYDLLKSQNDINVDTQELRSQNKEVDEIKEKDASTDASKDPPEDDSKDSESSLSRIELGSSPRSQCDIQEGSNSNNSCIEFAEFPGFLTKYLDKSGSSSSCVEFAENSSLNDTCNCHENTSDLINEFMDSALTELTKNCPNSEDFFKCLNDISAKTQEFRSQNKKVDKTKENDSSVDVSTDLPLNDSQDLESSCSHIEFGSSPRSQCDILERSISNNSCIEFSESPRSLTEYLDRSSSSSSCVEFAESLRSRSDLLERSDSICIDFGCTTKARADSICIEFGSTSDCDSIFCEDSEDSEDNETESEFEYDSCTLIGVKPMAKPKGCSFFVDPNDLSSDDESDDDDEKTESLSQTTFNEEFSSFGMFGLMSCNLTVSSSTSIITVCQVSDSCVPDFDKCTEDDSEDRNTSIKYINEKWNKEINEDIKTETPRKVSFDENPPRKHILYTWLYARQKARKGEWEMYARDRDRFKTRILRIEPILNKILSLDHRQSIYCKFHEDR